jgi:sulfopyruvate decarboxylase subunit beta
MNLGTLVTIANQSPKNLILVVIDNGCYGSTGGQPTYTARGASLAALARGAGCENVVVVGGEKVAEVMRGALGRDELMICVVHADPGNADTNVVDIGELKIRDRFMGFIQGRTVERRNRSLGDI